MVVKKFADQCLLWNKRCQGRREVALDNFFNQSGSMWHLVYHPCENEDHKYTPWCLPYLAPPNISSSLQNWMREPDCVTSFGEWHESHLDRPLWTYTDWDNNTEKVRSINWNQLTTDRAPNGCCKACTILGGNVDVYYWPEPGANTDCLSIIGTSVGNPDDDFFAADNRGIKHFKSKPNPWFTASTPADITPKLTQAPIRKVEPRLLGSHISGPHVLNQSAPINHTILGSTDIISDHTLYVIPDIQVVVLTRLIALRHLSTLGSVTLSLWIVVVPLDIMFITQC